jgi:hypothetical protein
MPPPGSTAPETRARPALHPLVYTALAGVGLLLVFMAVGIAMLVVILKDSRDHIRAQDKKTAVLLQKVQAAQPTASQVPELLDQARPVVRRLGKAAGPIQEAITSTAQATERLPMLVRATEALAREGIPVLNDIRSADLARVLPETRRAVEETPPLIRRLLDIQLATLDIQRVTLDVQRRSLRTQLTTLEIQREALKHIESIDRKTGGTVPAEGAPVPQP